MTYVTTKAINDRIITISLNRPDKRNALNLDLMAELSSLFEGLQQTNTHIAILTGTGNTFCSGLDLHEAADNQLIEKMAKHVARMLTAVYNSKLVTIAAVQGDAIAGGAGLAIACDFVLLSDSARMGFPEVRRGLVAAQVAVLMCRQMLMRNVRELLLTGELVDSQRAVTMGLANKAVSHKDLMEEAQALAEMVLQGAPEALKATKQLLHELSPKSSSNDLEIALSFHHAARQSAEAKEGIAAFLEKRPPNWVSCS